MLKFAIKKHLSFFLIVVVTLLSTILGYNYLMEINFNLICLTVFFCVVVFLLLIVNRKVTQHYAYYILFYIVLSISILNLVFTKSMLIFFLFYELLLLTSTILLHLSSPNIRSKYISFYFLIWTQFSSFFLWIGIFIFAYLYGSYYFFFYLNLYDNTYHATMSYLIIIAFAIKLPLYPFSFWLLKAHVEANTNFSIFLSGILVKTALIGLIKFSPLFDSLIVFLLLFISVWSVMSAAVNMLHQTDYKRLIALTTIQEMSLVIIFVVVPTSTNLNLLYYFVMLHMFLSFIMFFSNDLIYIRYKTRRLNSPLGLLSSLPHLSLIIVIMWLIFISVPFSVKFLFELNLFLKLSTTTSIIFNILVFFFLYLNILVFSKNVIIFLFGNSRKLSFNLTKKELLLFIFVTLSIIFICLV